MASKSAGEADTNFAYFFRESLSVITNAFLLAHADHDKRILMYEPPVKLQRKGGDPLYLAVTQTYRVVEPTPRQFKAKTTAYLYEVSVKRNSDELANVFEFHWHPDTTRSLKWPHLHVVGNTQDGNVERVHFPTARLAVEDLIRLLIRDFGVKTRIPYDNAKKILAKNKLALMQSASWLHWSPLI